MEGWIARDKNGRLFIYKDKPIKSFSHWFPHINGRFIPVYESDLSEGVNPKWEDDEPIEVKLKIEKL